MFYAINCRSIWNTKYLKYSITKIVFDILSILNTQYASLMFSESMVSRHTPVCASSLANRCFYFQSFLGLIPFKLNFQYTFSDDQGLNYKLSVNVHPNIFFKA